MAFQQFVASERNPNPDRACVCSMTHDIDCVGPYAVCHGGQRMLDMRNPHVVIGDRCVSKMRERLDGELLRVGEPENDGMAEPAPKKRRPRI